MLDTINVYTSHLTGVIDDPLNEDCLKLGFM